jgi:hypothetical protein
MALGLWLSGLAADWPGLHSDSFLSGLAMVFAVLAVLFTVRGKQVGGESIEAITGWIFLLSASGSVLLLSHSPHGLEEIHRLLSSSLIGASATEIGIFASLTALTSVVLLRFHRPIVLVTLDPLLAQAMGLKTQRWMGQCGHRPGPCHGALYSLRWPALYLWLPGATGTCSKKPLPRDPDYVHYGALHCPRQWVDRVHPGQSL